MGFGPKASSVESGVRAVKDLIELLYPEHATASSLSLVEHSTRALLSAGAALTFENIDRFWRDPKWRAEIMKLWPEPISGPWDSHDNQVLSPDALDKDFGWLLRDRIQATQSFLPDEEDSDPYALT
ncbi:MAG: hypothetical protein C7B45_12790 [Sulfobacillus acidophilus]|uniref:Uncharacterized protein n=1 Tax=Sulfobacillus acidophilus TaxID=53633 RepID=A0A2T2WFE4_9FIRM|nr:MAG: hypothetical protein C7B45_12790 [Sulfobacillus acidophilus]